MSFSQSDSPDIRRDFLVFETKSKGGTPFQEGPCTPPLFLMGNLQGSFWVEKEVEIIMSKLETVICNKDGTDTIKRGMYGEQQEQVACTHGYRVVVLSPNSENKTEGKDSGVSGESSIKRGRLNWSDFQW